MKSGKFLLLMALISVCISLYVLKPKNSFPSVKETQTFQQGWHGVETWTLGISTTVIFAVRAIDVFAFICEEDEDVKKETVRYALWFYKKAKRKLVRSIDLRCLSRRITLQSIHFAYDVHDNL